MKKSSQLKAVVAFLLLIVVLLLMKNHEKCSANRRFRIRRDDEGEKERWIWEKYLPYCKWDENTLRKSFYIYTKLLAVPRKRLLTKTKYQQNMCISTVKQMRIMAEL